MVVVFYCVREMFQVLRFNDEWTHCRFIFFNENKYINDAKDCLMYVDYFSFS